MEAPQGGGKYRASGLGRDVELSAECKHDQANVLPKFVCMWRIRRCNLPLNEGVNIFVNFWLFCLNFGIRLKPDVMSFASVCS